MQIFLKLVFTTLPHSLDFLFSKLKGHNSKLSIYSSIILSLAKLCKSVKLKLRAGRDLICWYYKDITGLNPVTFTRSRAGHMQVNLSAAKNIVNVKVIKDLLCFICHNGGWNKVPSRVTDLSKEETVPTIFFQHPNL